MKIGILLIAHGYSGREQNNLCISIANDIQTKLDGNKFSVKAAFLETQPFIFELLSDFKQEGIEDILAIPLFIGLSKHTLHEIPALIGTYFNPELETKLACKGNLAARSLCLRLSLVYSLADSGLIPDLMIEEIKEFYNRQERNSIIILAHGSKEYRSHWDMIFSEIERMALKNVGPMKIDICYIGFGTDFSMEAMPLIEKRLNSYDKVSILGMYAFQSAADIIDYHLKMNRLSPESVDKLNDKRVLISPKCVLPNPLIEEYILNQAEKFYQVNKKGAD